MRPCARGRIRNCLLAATDVLVVATAWIVALLAYDVLGSGHYRYAFYLRMWPVALGFVLLNAVLRLYHGRFLHPATPVSPVEEFRRLFASAVFVHAGAIAVIAIARQTTVDYSRAVILIAGLLTAVLSQPVRDLVRHLLHRFGFFRIPVHLIGGDALPKRVESLESDRHLGFAVVPAGIPAAIAIVDEDPRSGRSGRQLLDYTYIEYLPADGCLLPTVGRTVALSGQGGIEVENQRRIRVLRVEKWALDRILAILTFILVSPLFILVPMLIKLTSRGPVFYRQTRLGRNGREIRVWKFRSMYVDADERLAKILSSDPVRKAEWDAAFKLKDDPRVTPLGKFLRRTSLDEFPQLFNVFAGDMALVGPRPIVEKEVAHYGDAYETFSSVKPGITGLWQVSGRSDTDYPQRVALDLQYILNWSPWLDVWILFRTVSAVFLMRGAR